jgi:CheY-like chemotaxis protein
MPQLILAPLERTSPRAIPPAGLHLHYFPCVIGREIGCDVRILDPMVSRRHCRIDWHEGSPIVQDLGSSNGTAVNGEEISEPHVLHEGDLLQLGGCVFAVRLHDGPPLGTPQRILVVEDDDEAAQTLAVLLRGWGHDVEVAGDGDEALKTARAYRPEAVLLDINLGDGPNGLEVAHRLRGDPRLQNARLVAVTGQLPEEKNPNYGLNDLDTVLVKPVDVRTLREALAAVY